MGYVIDLHLFSHKLCFVMKKKKLTDKKGNPCPIALYNLLYPNDIITEAELKEDRQKATDKTRNIRNWINGKNYPKNISDILRLCNALEVDLDYLFTDMKCKTHNIQYISDKTGLSEDSINALISLNGSDCGFYYTPIIDCLIKDEKFTHHLMNKIDKHFRDYKHYRDLDIMYSEERKTLEINPLKPHNKKPTVSRHDLTLANNLAEAGHFQIQKEFDYILSNLIEFLYDNYPTDKAPGTD